jgi:protein-tyrosine phosphatase
MWFRRTNPTEPVDLSLLGTDFHSHLVPGVDDGADTLDEALAMVDGLVALGYRGAVTTPHIYPGIYPNSPAGLRKAFDPLRTAVASSHPGFALSLAAEYQIDPGFVEQVEAGGEILEYNGLVLVEVGFHAAPPAGLLEEAIFALQKRNLTPVLAHVERYGYWHGQDAVIEGIEGRGVLLQVNAGSIAGGYGDPVQDAAAHLLESGLVSFLGSDAHAPRHLEAMKALQSGQKGRAGRASRALQNWLATSNQAALLAT